MAAGHVIPEAIQALLEKRGTFQDWLSRLDQLGSDFRPEVAEKVRLDYESRLTAAEGELEGHRTELESALAERAEAVDQIASRHDSRAAELEETQLRHVVGEFDDAEWDKRRGEQQALIDELEVDLTAQRSAVESLQTVLGELTGAAAAAATTSVEAEPPIPEELVAAEDEWPEPEPAVEVEEPEPEAADEPDAWMTQPLDDVAEDVATAELVEADVVELELADAGFVDAEVVDAEVVEAEVVDEAVDDEVESAEEEAEAEEPEPGTAEAAADPGEFMDELEFLESLSLDDAENFDAVSAMLDEEEGDSGADEGSKKKTEDS